MQKRKRMIRLGLLIPLLFAFMWLIILLPSYDAPAEQFSPSILPSLIKSICIFIVIYGIAVMIFYSRLK